LSFAAPEITVPISDHTSEVEAVMEADALSAEAFAQNFRDIHDDLHKNILPSINDRLRKDGHEAISHHISVSKKQDKFIFHIVTAVSGSSSHNHLAVIDVKKNTDRWNEPRTIMNRDIRHIPNRSSNLDSFDRNVNTLNNNYFSVQVRNKTQSKPSDASRTTAVVPYTQPQSQAQGFSPNNSTKDKKNSTDLAVVPGQSVQDHKNPLNIVIEGDQPASSDKHQTSTTFGPENRSESNPAEKVQPQPQSNWWSGADTSTDADKPAEKAQPQSDWWSGADTSTDADKPAEQTGGQWLGSFFSSGSSTEHAESKPNNSTNLSTGSGDRVKSGGKKHVTGKDFIGNKPKTRVSHTKRKSITVPMTKSIQDDLILDGNEALSE